jgi:hypothetical protein
LHCARTVGFLIRAACGRRLRRGPVEPFVVRHDHPLRSNPEPMRPFSALVSLVALAAPALAQATLGITDNTTSMATSRGGVALANFNPVTVFNRIDRE